MIRIIQVMKKKISSSLIHFQFVAFCSTFHKTEEINFFKTVKISKKNLNFIFDNKSYNVLLNISNKCVTEYFFRKRLFLQNSLFLSSYVTIITKRFFYLKSFSKELMLKSWEENCLKLRKSRNIYFFTVTWPIRVIFIVIHRVVWIIESFHAAIRRLIVVEIAEELSHWGMMRIHCRFRVYLVNFMLKVWRFLYNQLLIDWRWFTSWWITRCWWSHHAHLLMVLFRIVRRWHGRWWRCRRLPINLCIWQVRIWIVFVW